MRITCVGLLLILAGCCGSQTETAPNPQTDFTPVTVGDITISGAYIDEPYVDNGVVTMQITNGGTEPIQLVGITCDACEFANIRKHEQNEHGIWQSFKVDAVTIDPGGTVQFQDRPYTVHLLGLDEASRKPGAAVEVGLQFDGAPECTLTVPVTASR